MNNIYKVIWSKAKNCYVVASEIAKSHTKSASGSEKMGGYGKKALLALVAASAIFCGGLVNVGATVHVNEGTGATSEVYTTGETYNKTEVDLALAAKGAANDVASNRTDIDNLKTAVGGPGSGLTKDVADQKADIATNRANINNLDGKLADLTTTVSGKADEAAVTTALDSKADTDLSNLTAAGETKIKDTMSADMANKADVTTVTTLEGRVSGVEGKVTALEGKVGDASSGLVKDVNDLKTQGNDLNNALGNKADKSELDAAKEKINANEGKITNLETQTGNLSTDGKSLTGMDAVSGTTVSGDTVNAGSLNVTGEISNGNGVTTTLEKINASMEKTNQNADKVADLEKKTSKIDYDAANDKTTINGVGISNTQVDMGGKDITNARALTATGKVIGDGVDAGTGAITGGSLTVTGKVTGNGVDAGAGDITTTGNVKGGTLETTGDAKIGGDLTVNGKLNVDEISMKNDRLDPNGDQHHSATTITADGISNNAKVTDKNGVTTESKFTHDKEGSTTYAKKSDATNWKESTSNVTADGVSNKMTDSAGNTHTYYQTAAETKEQLVNGDKSNFEKKTAEGNTISIKDKDADGNKKSLTNTQTVDEEKTSVTNKDSSSTIKQGADQIRHNVTSADGKKSSIEVKAEGITNTSKDGTITNDAKDIENNATGDITNTAQNGSIINKAENGNISNTAQNVTNEGTESVTNKVGNNEVKVSQNGVDITAEAGKKITESVGTASRVVENDKITDKAGDSTVTTENGKGTTFGKERSTDTTNIYGDSIKTGRINAKDTTTDKLTAGAAADAEGGRLTVDANDGVKGSYKFGNYTSKSYILANTLKSGVDNGKKPTDTDFVGSRTDHYMDGDKAKLDETVKDADGSNVTNKTSTGTVTTITDGATTTKTEQDTKDITNTAKGGTITNDAKDIVNNAQNTITNTAGTSITNQVKDSKVTTDANGTTFENKTAAVSDGGATTTQINGNHINTGRVDANELGVFDTDGNNKANLSVKAGEGVKASASNGTTTGSLDVTGDKVESSVKDGDNETSIKQTATDITNTAKDGTIKNDAKDIVTNASNSITEKVGETNVTTKTTTSSKSEIQNADTITSVQQTENMVQSFVGKKDFSTTNVTTNLVNASANAVTENGQTSTVLNNKDGLLVRNTANGKRFTTADGTNTGTALEWTNVKGNEISTGKVEANYVKMDYADVMKDLGVHGNAKVAKNLEVGETTTTKTLKVTQNATVGGTLDVTQRATFHDDVDIANNLSVGKAVTAKSYKVGEKTYIDENGIHANGQKITDVADGSISEGSKDAVNGGQLYNVKNDLEGKVNKVGANAAAMANLHPMEFDPDSKWNIAAAIGNYGSETAAALGAFYRPNDDVMVNLSTAFGTGENMVGGGVSVRLGKGGNKLSREESNALKDQVNDLTARMDALLSVLNPNMSKDFPDVPENHWAYEAVSRLAGNDIVQGYPDGEFHGERTMTRYEMAEIIYNALSRGAEAEKELVEEFKPELQAMAASEKATAERAEG